MKHSDQSKKNPSKGNNSQSFFSGKSGSFFGTQAVQKKSAGFFTPKPTIQKKSNEDQDSKLSLADAKKAILDATVNKLIGTDEDAVYTAIRNCNSRKSLLNDATVMSALKGDMGGHDLWKCFLLMEYSKESDFPAPIQDLWTATKGPGTNEDDVFTALNNMDKRAKTSYGLKDILEKELSRGDLQKALDLIVTSDSIKGNIYGAGGGQEELVVSEDNMRELIGSQFAGGASEGLKGAMTALYNPEINKEALDRALAQVESIRGLPAGSALGEYHKAMKVQKDGIAYYKKKKEAAGHEYDHLEDNPSPPLSSDNADFTASNAQLRFGKIVGDVFGIDAVFGSLVSPTGGMAGAGNSRVPGVGNDSPIAHHGAIHDVAGYLYNCHGIGPGYDYFQSEPGAEPDNPFAGQTNMEWWIEEFKKSGNDEGFIGGNVSKLYNKNAPILAAFSKDYSKLNVDQKKESLKIMCETWGIILDQLDITNEDRVARIRNLMNVSSNGDKNILADYYYNNDRFGASQEVNHIMQPHVSKEVYDAYLQRLQARQEALRALSSPY